MIGQDHVPWRAWGKICIRLARPHWITLLGILPAVLAVGCSGSTAPRCYPVSGRVEMGGDPVVEAMVVFHPLAGQTKDAPKPIAYTDAKGAFSLTMLQRGDGAPAGEYAISVELREPVLVGEEYTRTGRHLLPERYADPDLSGLRYTVVAGPNEVPPLALAAE